MTLVKSILGIVPGLQATALVGHNLKLIPNFKMKPSKGIRPKPIKQIVKASVGTLVGISLIKPTASMINKL